MQPPLTGVRYVLKDTAIGWEKTARSFLFACASIAGSRVNLETGLSPLTQRRAHDTLSAMKQRLKPLVWPVVVVLAERGLDISGLTNIYVALVLWLLALSFLTIWLDNWVWFKQRHRLWVGRSVVAIIAVILAAIVLNKQWTPQAKIVTTTPPSGMPSDIAKWQLGNNPDNLTLHDLFLIDFDSVQQQASGSMFVDDAKKISVEYLINTELALRSKFLSFYIPRHDHTAAICRYLAQQHEFVLDKAPQLLVEQKSPGDSRTISTKEADFTGRIYVYHETYLPAEETVKLSSFYERLGLSGIFRSTDYRSTKVLEAKVRLAQKVNEAPN